MPQASPPVVDFIAYAQRDQVRTSGDEGRERVRLAGFGSPRSGSGRLAGWNESVAGVYDRAGRDSFRRKSANSNVGDARRTRTGDSRVRARGLHRSCRHVRRDVSPEHLLHGHVVQAWRISFYRIQAACTRRAGRTSHRRPSEALEHGDDRVDGAGETSDAASAALRSHRIAATRQPSVGLQCQANARTRAGVI